MWTDAGARWQASFMDNYGTPALTLVRGEGAHVWDADGNRYLDLVGGIAVNALGHAHPAVVEAVTAQIATLGHTSNLYVNPVAVELAEALLDVAGARRAGQGAVLQLGRGGRRGRDQAGPAHRPRPKLVASEGAFHGRTMGALTAHRPAGQARRRSSRCCPAQHVPFGDVDALRAAVDGDTAAVFVEPVLGEGGVTRAGRLPAGRARDHQRRRRAAGPRRGADRHRPHRQLVRASSRPASRPDVVTLAKGLGGGLPLGACIGVGAAGDAARARPARHHLRRQPGRLRRRPRGAAHDRRRRAVRAGAALGKEIVAGVEALGHPLVDRGARRGPAARHRPRRAGRRARSPRPRATAGYLVNNVAPDTIRLAPPLIADQRRRSRTSWPRCPRSSTKRARWSGTSCATTTCPRPSRPRCSTSPTG